MAGKTGKNFGMEAQLQLIGLISFTLEKKFFRKIAKLPYQPTTGYRENRFLKNSNRAKFESMRDSNLRKKNSQKNIDDFKLKFSN